MSRWSGSPSRRWLERALTPITVVWVFAQLLSLRLGLLNRFFFDTLHADVQGIDFYSLPKAWLNLRAGRSLYASFDPPAYGPHFTWYLSHPLLAVVLGWPLSHLQPADSYGVFTLVSLGAMALSAAVLALQAEGRLQKQLIALLLLGAFPTFAMLWVGNVQAFPVLALSLLFAGLLRCARFQAQGTVLVAAGLLLSLFTKPVVLLMLPLLLLLREMRRAAAGSLGMYAGISLLFEVVPALNPQGVGLRRVAWLAGHPGYVRSTMDIYRNHFVLTPDMRDNSVHWFNLIAQSGFRLEHIDVFSLPVLLDGVLGVRTPDLLYLLPGLVVLLLSFAVARVRDAAARREAALVLTLAASLSFFLSYPTVWEYQYTAVLPVAAVLLLLRGSARFTRRGWVVAFALACCAFLPSPYFLFDANTLSASALAILRLSRVLPALLLFVGLLWSVARQLPRPAFVAR